MLRPVRPARPAAPLVWILALTLAAAAGAQEVTIDVPELLSPESDVEVEITYLTNCLRSHEVEVVPEKELVRVTAVEGCTCPASVAVPTTFSAELGRLPAAVHRLELFVAHREEASPLPCGLPRRLAEAEVVVSRSGFVHQLGVAPAAPRPGEPAGLRIGTLCGTAWAPPVVTGPPRERVIRLIPTNGPLPSPAAFRLTPCAGNGREQVLPLGALPAGVYRVDVMDPGGEVEVATRFTVAPAPGEALALGLAGGPPDRFRVRTTWRDPQGLAGSARPGTLTGQTGYLWFFDTDNVEAVVKVVDGCALNGRLWVFLAGLTDVEAHVTVEDTATGEVRTYVNPLGVPFAPVQDTGALIGCPGGR